MRPAESLRARGKSGGLERGVLLESALLAGLTAGFYLLVLSRQYAGDGVRYLPELLDARPELGMNKHVMFPALFWGVAKIARSVGLLSALGASFARPPLLVICQGLNALLGAVGVATLYLWQRAAGGSRKIAFLLSGVLALSNAYALHATDMTEPIAAIPWVLGAAALVRLDPDRRFRLFLGGALVGIAATFYVSALLGCALLGSAAVRRLQETRSLARALSAALQILAAACVSYLLMFVLLSWSLGTNPTYLAS